MQKLDLNKIALSERKILYIVEDYTDRLAWKILKHENSPNDHKIVTIDEFLSFARKASVNGEKKSNEFVPSAGDVLVWVRKEEGYAKFENFNAINLMAFHNYAVEILKVKDLKISYHKNDKEEIDRGGGGSLKGDLKISPKNKKFTGGMEVNIQDVKEFVEKISEYFDFHGNENESLPVNIQDQEDNLKLNGLFYENSLYKYALTMCQAKSRDTEFKYEFFKNFKENFSAHAEIGANLADFLGIEAFANYHKTLEKESTV